MLREEYVTMKVKKILAENCQHLILEKEISYLGSPQEWRCIFCDQIVKLKTKKNGLQKRFKK